MSEVDDKVIDAIFSRLSAIENRQASMGHESNDLATWLPEAFHEPGIIGGIIVDEGKARESECKCVPLGKNRLCYVHGVVGALSREQEPLYCSNPIMLDLPAETVERTRILRDATVFCQGEVHNMPTDERLQPFMSCLVKIAKKQGLEI
jgi:hypothetical protein